MITLGFPSGTLVKKPPAMQETPVSLIPGSGDPLQKGMATHSSILAWRIPCTEEACGLQSMGLQRVEHNWANPHIHEKCSCCYCITEQGSRWCLLEDFLEEIIHEQTLKNYWINKWSGFKEGESTEKEIWETARQYTQVWKQEGTHLLGTVSPSFFFFFSSKCFFKAAAEIVSWGRGWVYRYQ